MIHFERPTGFSAIMNWYNSSNSPGEQTLRTIQSDAAGSLPNVHSDKIFLVKMQSSLKLTNAGAQMLTYD